jgi:hypothetical protein
MTSRTGNWDVTLVLPLKAAANQLLKIETQLRHLNLKATASIEARERTETARCLAERLEDIHEALESLKKLVADMEADLSWASGGGRSGKRTPAAED